MTPLRALVRMRWATVRNSAFNIKADSLSKVFVVIFGLGNVLGIGYYISRETFHFIEQFPAFGPALSAKMIGLLFFALFALVVLSTVIVAYATLFLARETEFLFQLPVPPRDVLLLKASEAIAFSTWASLFLCLPVLVSFGMRRQAPLLYYFEASAILLVFLLLAALLGMALALLLAPVVRRLSPRALLGLAVALLAWLAWLFLQSFDLASLRDDNSLLFLDRMVSRLSTVSSPYFPGHWASSAILAAVAGDQREVLFYGLTLLANAAIFWPLVTGHGRRGYWSQWVLARSASPGAAVFRRRSARGRTIFPRPRRLSALRALLHKDALQFLRDPAQLSQSLLFVVLMIIYSLSLLHIPKAFLATDRLRWMLHLANLSAVCMILSSFTSRFLFPLLSLEGRSFWILGLAPLPKSYLVRQKLIFGLGITWFLGLVTTYISNAALRAPPDLFGASLFTVLLAGVCLTSLSSGLGAAYPSFEEDNPARIAVGLGGTLNFFASALSIAVLLSIEAFPFWSGLYKTGAKWMWISHASALGFTAALSLIVYRIGTRSLARRDF